MSDEELRDALRTLATPVPAHAGQRDSVLAEVDRRQRRRRWVGGGLAAAAGVTAVALSASVLTGGIGGDESGPAGVDEAAGSWTPLAQSPLSPREHEFAVWTGSEMIVAGGEIPTCPPMGDCYPLPVEMLGDGAAYDPTGDTWRSIADAPQSMAQGQAVWTGTEMLVTAPELLDPSQPEGAAEVQQQAATLAYDPEADSWRRLPEPPVDYLDLPAFTYLDEPSVEWTGEVLLYWAQTREFEAGDWMLDPSTETWSRLPDDPFPATYDRDYTWTPAGPVLTAARGRGERVQGPEVLVARLNLETSQWRVLASPPRGPWSMGWHWFEGYLVNPLPQPADPQMGVPGVGGILDLDSGDWRPLPQTTGAEDGCNLPTSGSTGPWLASNIGTLVSVVPYAAAVVPECLQVSNPQVGVWTGTEFLVYGGEDAKYTELVNTGLRWTPPAPE